MIKLHEKASRGRTKTGWLDSYHTFSFGSFNDPTRMGFGNLRVINEDTIAPGSGFAFHEHKDMDILTIVLNGELLHEDDHGNRTQINEGEVQLMSAGSGLRHSERNASMSARARFLQIWMLPDAPGGQPTYAQAAIPSGRCVPLASAHDGLVTLRSHSSVTLRRFDEGENLELSPETDVLRYIHFVDGMALSNTEKLSAGDGLEIPPSEDLQISWTSDGTAIFFDIPIAKKEHLQ